MMEQLTNSRTMLKLHSKTLTTPILISN
uniref:Uncharacterized protein n=1 Tax=Rhizophora mucronata TaxID=61149 RepID=A0A2P2R042_RHIMU